MKPINDVARLKAPLAMSTEEFSEVGHKLVDKIAEFLNNLPRKPVTTGEQPAKIRAVLGNNKLPVNGASAEALIDEAAELLFNHSLFNGHPGFWGYITSSATPIGALGDLLASWLPARQKRVGIYERKGLMHIMINQELNIQTNSY